MEEHGAQKKMNGAMFYSLIFDLLGIKKKEKGRWGGHVTQQAWV